MESKVINLRGLEYRVFENGDIIGLGRNKKLKQRLNCDGYPEVTVGTMENRTSMRIHRIVALTFLEKPSDYDKIVYEVDHFDDNRQNNHVSNLRYMTHADNVKKAYERGNHKGTKTGIKNGRAKYTEEEVLKIREMYDSGVSVMEILKYFHPTWVYKERKNKWGTFKHICDRDTWTHI